MIWPGANGSEAKYISTKTKETNSNVEMPKETTVKGIVHDTLLPLSRPSKSPKTAPTRMIAPRKSMRRSLSFQWLSSSTGKFRAVETATKARMQRGNCAMKALACNQHWTRKVCNQKDIPTPANVVGQNTAWCRATQQVGHLSHRGHGAPYPMVHQFRHQLHR